MLATDALISMARMRKPLPIPSFVSILMDSLGFPRPGCGDQRVYRRGASAALEERRLKDVGRGYLVEGKVLGETASALLPGEEQAAVTVGEAGGGIDAKFG
jgi:hypothetical protein